MINRILSISISIFVVTAKYSPTNLLNSIGFNAQTQDVLFTAKHRPYGLLSAEEQYNHILIPVPNGASHELFESLSRHGSRFQCKYLRQNSAGDIISGSFGKCFRFPVINVAWQYLATS